MGVTAVVLCVSFEQMGRRLEVEAAIDRINHAGQPLASHGGLGGGGGGGLGWLCGGVVRGGVKVVLEVEV